MRSIKIDVTGSLANVTECGMVVSGTVEETLPLTILCGIATLLLGFICSYAYPLTAFFENTVLQTLKNAMRADHTRSHVFGFTHLGLVELTRKKTGRSIGDTLKVTCPCCDGEAKVLSPYTVFNRLRKQTLQILKGSKIRRMYIEVHPSVKEAMETLQKRNGVLFPEVDDAAFFIRANECLHPEKYSVRPLPDKKVAEFKKICTVMR